MASTGSGLESLEKSVARGLALLGPEPENWVADRPGIDLDVLVVGGGQSGIGTAFALRRLGIARTLVIDAAAIGKAGVWRRSARMRTLRTAKSIPTLEAGIPELSFRAWYEARHGERAYADIGRIALEDWSAYVDWFGKQARIDVRHDTELLDIIPRADRLEAVLSGPESRKSLAVRRIVLATGVGGLGGPYSPEHLFGALPPSLYAHTGHDIDFSALAGKRIGILGAGSSAFDAAATALEAGADTVDLFARAPAIARLPDRPINRHLGAQLFFSELSDALKLEFIRHASEGASVPPESVERAQKHDNFTLHLAAPWHETHAEHGRVRVSAADGRYQFDFLIAGTGYSADPSRRPELARIAPHVALWRDRVPDPGDRDLTRLGRTPYINSDFTFVEKEEGKAPFLSKIHVYNAGASLSFSRHVGDIGHQSIGVPRLANAIARSLFLEDHAESVSTLYPRPAAPHDDVVQTARPDKIQARANG